LSVEIPQTNPFCPTPQAEIRRLSVLVPVYNEQATVRKLIERVVISPVELELEIIVVDDGSADESWSILSELADEHAQVKLIRHDKNSGKGAAIRTAIEHATGEVAIVQDADLEYDPSDYGRLLEPILQGEAAAVFGSRFAGSRRQSMSFWHTVANRSLTALCNIVNGLQLTDMETCYKMIRMDVLRHLRLRANSFTLEPELTARLAQCKAPIVEVPINYTGRGYADGKKIGLVDFVKACAEIFRSGVWDRRFTDNEEFRARATTRSALKTAQKSD
jgi:glycosyltransferase involved in cell wall biosynthesis